MSDSYPTLQGTLTGRQQDSMGCVEMHVDPPDYGVSTYEVDARYHADDLGDGQLPGCALRFVVAQDEDEGDVFERRHTIQFFEHDDDEPAAEIGHVSHSLKRIE